MGKEGGRKGTALRESTIRYHIREMKILPKKGSER